MVIAAMKFVIKIFENSFPPLLCHLCVVATLTSVKWGCCRHHHRLDDLSAAEVGWKQNFNLLTMLEERRPWGHANNQYQPLRVTGVICCNTVVSQ